MPAYLYDLAASFAGEQRALALSLASRLDASGYSIFYDGFEAAQLWGTELPVKLGEIYGKQARFCLILVSHEYVNKMWTNVERRFAISRTISERIDYILPIKIDNSELPGLPPTIGYVDLRNTTEDEIYSLLLQKLGLPDHESSGVGVSPEDQERVRQILQACYRRAIFTKMESEINMDAMFSSLGQSLGEVQQIIPKLKAPDLQYSGLTILRALDQLERYISRNRVDYSNSYPTEVKHEMDELKLQIVQSLLQLRRRARIQFQLPTALKIDHFYSIEQANEQPLRY
jgi:hypothetical protein